MTFRVTDLMIEPTPRKATEPKLAKKKAKPKVQPRRDVCGKCTICTKCTACTGCSACSRCSGCTMCTACSVCTFCTKRTGVTGCGDPSSACGIESAAEGRNLAALREALRVRLESVQRVA